MGEGRRRLNYNCRSMGSAPSASGRSGTQVFNQGGGKRRLRIGQFSPIGAHLGKLSHRKPLYLLDLP
jgi:hypothetical protein